MDKRRIIRAALAGLTVRTPRQMRRAERPPPVPEAQWEWDWEGRQAQIDSVEELYAELGGEG